MKGRDAQDDSTDNSNRVMADNPLITMMVMARQKDVLPVDASLFQTVLLLIAAYQT